MSAKKQKKNHQILYLLLALFLIANGIAWASVGYQKAYAGKIPPGVIVSGQDISGLTESEALTRLTQIHQSILNQEITLTHNTYTYNTTLEKLDYSLNTEESVKKAIIGAKARNIFQKIAAFFITKSQPASTLAYSLDKGKFQNIVDQVESDISKEPRDISIEYKDGAITVVPAENGTELDSDSFETMLVTAVSQSNLSQPLPIPVTFTAPAIADETQIANAKLQLQTLLAQALQVKVTQDNTDVLTYDIKPDTLYSFVIMSSENNAVSLTFDETKIKTEAEAISKKVSLTPITKKVYTVDNSTLQEGRDGRKLNVADATSKIRDALKSFTPNTPVVLAAEKVDRKTITEGAEYELGRTEGKYIDVDLSRQRLNIIENNVHQHGFTVSTGKWSSPTPIGEFTILNHHKTAWSKRYKLYMPFWMAIKRENGTYDGYGIHGLPYWPNGAVEGTNHIGTAVSHGCIRLGPGDAEFVYNWATDGTKVYIHE